MRAEHSTHLLHICGEERRAAGISSNAEGRRHASAANVSCSAGVLAQLLPLETGPRMCVAPVLHPAALLRLAANCGPPLRAS